MKPNRFQRLQLPSLNLILLFMLLAWALSSIGLGGLIQSILIVLAILTVLPAIVVALAQWWVKRNLVQADCPTCGMELTGVNEMELQCPNCGEHLRVDGGKFVCRSPSGTIDVDVVDVGVVDVTALPEEEP